MTWGQILTKIPEKIFYSVSFKEQLLFIIMWSKTIKQFLKINVIFIEFLHVLSNFFKGFIYLFLERGEGREKERERNINVWLPLTWPPLGTWPTTQACALTGNQTSDPLVHSPRSFH